MDTLNIRKNAPWLIPEDAQLTYEQKQGYQQIKFTWQAQHWRYEARFHNKTPLARLITYPSWRLDRTKPGKGFGPDHAPRIEETLVGKKWIKSSYVRYCASQVSNNVANDEQIQVIKLAHFRTK